MCYCKYDLYLKYLYSDLKIYLTLICHRYHENLLILLFNITMQFLIYHLTIHYLQYLCFNVSQSSEFQLKLNHDHLTLATQILLPTIPTLYFHVITVILLTQHYYYNFNFGHFINVCPDLVQFKSMVVLIIDLIFMHLFIIQKFHFCIFLQDFLAFQYDRK